MRAVRLGRDHRQAGVGRLADGHVERNLAEERHAQPLRLLARAAMAEDVGPLPQCGQMKVDMFSTMPSTGTSTLRNIAMPRRASISARSCGVETITAPASGTAWAIVSCASPVPGGMSTTRTSSAPHSTSRSICCSADITIGPRQMTGVSSSIRNPIDITFSP